jgi:hypothetical protein
MARIGNVASTITIGCKLPNGLILTNPLNPSDKVTIKGLNSAPRGMNDQPIEIPYATTEVDKDFWEAWLLMHNPKNNPFKPLASGALFECGTRDNAEAVYREREKEKTGLEPLKHTENGVKPLSKD